MKILVTGATGFLGGALCERLLVVGERDVRCLVRAGADASRLDAIARRYDGATVERFRGALTPSGASAAVRGVDVVYHLAARLAGAPADVFANTVVASKHLLEAIVHEGRRARVVLVSSFGVYGVAGLPRGALVDESTPLEERPGQRDVYSHAKLRQEQLFREYQARHDLPLVVLRPGVVYGPGGTRISARVGLAVPGGFLHLGGDNLLPLTHVDNCADAIALAGRCADAIGETYNVVDDDLPTARAYLARYRREVEDLRVIPVPLPLLEVGSSLVERYHRWSKGQLPAVFTPYKTRTSWKGTRFTNAKLKSLGWRPRISTEAGLASTFAHFARRPS